MIHFITRHRGSWLRDGFKPRDVIRLPHGYGRIISVDSHVVSVRQLSRFESMWYRIHDAVARLTHRALRMMVSA